MTQRRIFQLSSLLTVVLSSSLLVTPMTACADEGHDLDGAPAAALIGPSGGKLDDGKRKELESGKILSDLLPDDGKGSRMSVAVGVISAPPEAVFRTLRDYPHFAQYMPHVAKADVLSHTGNEYLVHVSVKGAMGMGNREYEQRVFDEKTKVGDVEALVSRFEYTGKGNITSATGRWVLVPIAGGKKTLCRYENRLDPGGSIPTWMKNKGVKSGVENALSAVRKHSEGGGH